MADSHFEKYLELKNYVSMAIKAEKSLFMLVKLRTIEVRLGSNTSGKNKKDWKMISRSMSTNPAILKYPNSLNDSLLDNIPEIPVVSTQSDNSRDTPIFMNPI